jgi:polysaccharide transporter, PST family
MVSLLIDKIHGKLNNHRKLFVNISFLGLIQLSNYLLPLITVPYIIRALGTEKFGLIAFAQSFIAYFQVTVDYGFNLSATRQASILRNDHEKLSSLFFSVLVIKLIIGVFCSLIILTLCILLKQFHPEMELYLVLFAGVLGTIFFPTWLFQGKEEMGFITFFNLLNRSIITVLIFILIKTPNDYLLYAYLNSGAVWIIGITSSIIVLIRYRLKPTRITLTMIKDSLIGGWEIFISQASVTLFTNTNTFFLGLFTNNQIVGVYAIADKIVRAVISLCGPVCNAIFPKVSLLFAESPKKALAFLQKALAGGSVIFGCLSFCLFIFAGLIVELITGTKHPDITLLIRIMSILPLSVFADNIYGTQIMLNINLKKKFMAIILGGGLCSLALLIVLVPHIQALGSAIAFVVSELFILIAMFISVKNAGINLLSQVNHSFSHEKTERSSKEAASE